MNYGWNEHATNVDVRSFIGGDSPAAVFEIGQYQVTLQGPTPENPPDVTYIKKRHESGDPRRTFPNMEVLDGVLKIPVEDIVGEMLTRLDPVDLSRTLWTENKEVRAEFMHCMIETYTDGTLDDADRREFLRAVKEAVHSKAIAVLAEQFSSSEFNLCRTVYYYDQIRAANDALRRAEDTVRQITGNEAFTFRRLADDGQNELTRIGGTVWNEARDYWRDRIATLFPSAEKDTVERTVLKA